MTIPATSNPAPADLLAPAPLGPYTLANRVVMAPMTRNRADHRHAPGPHASEYYAQRATVGLIITEATQASLQGVGYPGTPGIHEPDHVAGWRCVTDAVHAAGGRIFLQMWHVGRISHPSLQPGGGLPVAPSAIRPEGDAITATGMQPYVTPRALDPGELPGIVAQFRDGARHALAAGFDGVEIHAANGYLIDQFLRDGTNRRTDVYGGSPANRARLLLEVTEAVTGVWGAQRTGVRISPLGAFNSMSDTDPRATFTHVVAALGAWSLAYLHVIGLRDPAAGPAFDFAELRRLHQGAYIANGGYDFASARAAIASGEADFVSFGVPLIANPDLVERFRRGAPLAEPDRTTFYGGDARGYTDYPFLDPAGGHLAARA